MWYVRMTIKVSTIKVESEFATTCKLSLAKSLTDLERKCELYGLECSHFTKSTKIAIINYII